MPREYTPAFAIVRVDDFHEAEVSLEERISIKEVVATQALAEDEVARLTKLSAAKGCRYFWQHTRVLQPFESRGGSSSNPTPQNA